MNNKDAIEILKIFVNLDKSQIQNANGLTEAEIAEVIFVYKQAITKAITALEGGWVRVSDRLPENGECVNIKLKDGRYSNSWYQPNNIWAYYTDNPPTHWKPIQQRERTDNG